MKLFNASAWKIFHSIQLSGSSHQKMFLSRPFGNLDIGISASASSLESTLASALQKICFCLQKLFFENRITMFFLELSYGISTTLLQIRVPCHPSKGVYWCSRKRLFELSEAPVRGCFEKNNCFKNFWIFCLLSSETSRVELLLSTLVGPPGILLAPVSVKRNFIAHVISGIFQNFKNMQGKAVGCNLNNCSLLKGTP